MLVCVRKQDGWTNRSPHTFARGSSIHHTLSLKPLSSSGTSRHRSLASTHETSGIMRRGPILSPFSNLFGWRVRLPGFPSNLGKKKSGILDRGESREVSLGVETGMGANLRDTGNRNEVPDFGPRTTTHIRRPKTPFILSYLGTTLLSNQLCLLHLIARR